MNIEIYGERHLVTSHSFSKAEGSYVVHLNTSMKRPSFSVCPSYEEKKTEIILWSNGLDEDRAEAKACMISLTIPDLDISKFEVFEKTFGRWQIRLFFLSPPHAYECA